MYSNKMSVASDSPSKGDSDETGDKVFVCPSIGCNQKFDSEDSFAVHKQKHQMTLTLGPSKLTSLADVLHVDQTPTPTRFLHLGNQMGLFDELNPFDKDFITAQKEGISSKRRVAQHIQALNHKSKSPSTPTRSFATSFDGTAYSVAGQPVQVIALTPTLSSPVTALTSGTSPFLVPPLLPSPQGLHIPALPGYTATSPMQVPASILSPTLMPFTPGLMPVGSFSSTPMMEDFKLMYNYRLIPGMPALVDAQQRAAAFTQAMFAAAVSAASPLLPEPGTSFSETAQRSTEHITAVPSAVTTLNAHTTLANTRKHEALTIPSIVLPKQERPMSVSSSTSESNSNYADMPNSIQQQTAQSVEPFQQDNVMQQYPAVMRLSNGQEVTAPPSMPTSTYVTDFSRTSSNLQQPAQNDMLSHVPLGHRSSSEFGSNPNLLDAKQKLKETLTSNKPNLQAQSIANQNMSLLGGSSMGSDSGGEQRTPGRKRGRQSQDIDPDIKRQRFLERNRAAASRCRNKKKQWVNGLETKAKSLSQVNVHLQNEIATLKDEIATLKQLLLSHRDCPIMKMQQQSMTLAGINLDLTPSSSSVTVKSESHPSLVSTLSNQSLDENSMPPQQTHASSTLANGAIFSSLSSSVTSS